MDDIDDKKTSLYVGNLDRRCTEQFVKDIFSKCGKVVRCKMINASSSTDPYCFVEFEKRKDAEYALCAMNNRTVYDKNIKVNWATNNTGGMRKDTSNHYHIFVGDLDPEIENEGLYKAFSAFGQVSDCRVVKDTTSGKSKGYGFVSFVKKEDAEKAMREMKGQQLKGRNIRTNWAARKAMVPATKQLSLEEISRQASPYNSTVYVGNLPPGCTDDTLRQNFSHFGQIYDIKIFPEKFYGFIKFYTHDQALDAIYKSQRTVLGDNLLKCSWGKEQTDMNNAQSAMQQWQQYYQQYYQQVYNQQPMQQQSPAQAGYVQYPAAAAAAQYVYYPQQPFGNQPMQVVQAAMPGYPVNFFHLGCFKDYPIRAIPEVLGVWRLESNATQRCAQAAKRAGYLVFGVQDGGECWSGPLAQETYKKYGASTSCVDGTGWAWAQDVYRIVNASLIANYDVKSCYEVEITFYYQIQGGLTSSTINNTRKTFSDLLSRMSSILSSLPECSNVTVTRKDIINSPPGVRSVFFRIPLIFTASTSVPDYEVSKELTVCISTLSAYKQFLDSSTPKIKQGNISYSNYNLSSISNKKSCCCGDIPPPCCAVGSIRINSTKCGCLPGFHFVPGNLCERCPSDTYQDEQGQSSCKKCSGRKQTFGKTGMTSNSGCLDPPLIGNYDVKRCYVLDVIFNYRIPGGLTVNTTRNLIGEFQSLFLVVHNLSLSLQQCKEVIVTIGNIASSPPGVSLVYFRVPLTFTASNNIADDQVAINVTTCVNAANVSLKGYIDRSAPNITQNKTTYQINQQSSLEMKSCCGGDIPPPCCAVGSIKVSNTSCGCLPGFHHVTGRSCVPCPSDTYQDEQGQKSCKTCPANTVTFGKTRMTHKANCTGCLPGFHFVTGRSCVSCPSDTYQDEHGQKYCKTCPVNTGTFGKTRMTNQANCTDTNPLQVNDQAVFLPENINNETIVVNVTVTAVLASLVRPFKFYVDNVTQPRLLSREVSWRKRRRVDVDSQCAHPELCPQMLVDLCFKAGVVKPENYFCIHRFTGRIRVTQDFVFKQGEVFDLQIRVTDSDPRGITVNTAKVKLISADPCRKVQAIYDKAVKYCIKNSESVDGGKKCLSTQCTLTAHDWKEALNNASKVPEKDCSADPHNLTVLIRENPLCGVSVWTKENGAIFTISPSLTAVRPVENC